MQIQFTRKQIVNIVLMVTLSLGIGSFNSQPAVAQIDRSAFLEMARELNLSRSQMQAVAGIMRGFNADLEDILTPEQYALMQSAREQQQSQDQAPQALQGALNLTDTQLTQIATERTEMMAELQAVLTPAQIEGLMEQVGFNRL